MKKFLICATGVIGVLGLGYYGLKKYSERKLADLYKGLSEEDIAKACQEGLDAFKEQIKKEGE